MIEVLRVASVSRWSLLVVLLSVKGHAEDCRPASLQSSCVDSNAQWLPFGGTRLLTIPRSESLADGELSLGLHGAYQKDPIVLVAPSPDPEGREVPVVGDVLDTSMLVALGLGHGLEFGAAFSLVPWQVGSGVQGLTTSRGQPLSETALRDPRLGVGLELFSGEQASFQLSGRSRFEVTLPLGDKEAFAGQLGAVWVPAVSFTLQRSPMEVGVDLALRLKKTVPLGGVRLGSEFVSTLGAGWEVLDQERLQVVAELMLAPSLVSEPSVAGVTPRQLRSEWSLGVKTALGAWLSLTASGGTGLPLAKTPVDHGSAGVRGESAFAVTVPLMRFGLTLRAVQE